MDVSDVLRDRMHEPSGLQRMALLSAVAHGAIVALIVFAPRGWFQTTSDAPKLVMSISLGGGTPGPVNGGMTQIGGKAVQEPAPPDAKRQPITPPAAKAPEMTMPLPTAKPTKAATQTVKQAPEQAKGRVTSKGDPTPGSSNVDTGVRGQGFGLSSGGGHGSGIDIDVGAFCCPDYLTQVVEIIKRNWNDQSDVHDNVKIRVTIQRDGTLTNPTVEQASRSILNTNAAQTAVRAARAVPPLPREYTNATLSLGFVFQYQ
ncbi:MAG TPA: TonB C-terminal domain-containing protein [Vicinamibacterales bacterium]|nr:TonB C-terminal domain-containing protein [Vicinamibacterales bacterium]